jgi:hypothetical protein
MTQVSHAQPARNDAASSRATRVSALHAYGQLAVESPLGEACKASYGAIE